MERLLSLLREFKNEDGEFTVRPCDGRWEAEVTLYPSALAGKDGAKVTCRGTDPTAALAVALEAALVKG
jgi:hypothetical protein